MTILDKVTALLGEGAVLEAGTDRVPRVAPGSPDAVALLLGTAHQEGWRVRIEGAGTWLQSDAPADLALTTRRLDRIPAIEPSAPTAPAGGRRAHARRARARLAGPRAARALGPGRAARRIARAGGGGRSGTRRREWRRPVLAATGRGGTCVLDAAGGGILGSARDVPHRRRPGGE